MLKVVKNIIGLTIFLSCTLHSFSQDENNLWKGNKSYQDRQYNKAQESYQNSLELLPSDEATYNMANTLYKQQKYADAAKLFKSVADQTDDKDLKAEAFHNLGNSYLKSKELDKGIEAYKNALRNNPNDEETRYNLSYALKMKQEQEKKDDDQKKDDKKDDQKDKDKEDQQQDKDKQDENKDQDKEQNQDQQDEQKQDQEQQQEEKPQPNEISKEDAERLLDNLENEEEKTQEKMQKKKRKSNVKIENDW